MIRILIFLGAITLLFSSCLDSNFKECNDLELKIKGLCQTTDSIYMIPIASLTDFKWDELYVISGPTVDDEAEEIIGIDYKGIILDNRRQYIFIKDGKIIKEDCSFCDVTLSGKDQYSLGSKYLYNSVLRVKKKEGEGHFIYFVEEEV
jgi:hypothetical protein